MTENEDRERAVADIRSSIASGRRPTQMERSMLAADDARRVEQRILTAMRDHPGDEVRTAVFHLISEMMAISIANAMKREALEDRIAALEHMVADAALARRPRRVA